jgi:hypothetical protein
MHSPMRLPLSPPVGRQGRRLLPVQKRWRWHFEGRAVGRRKIRTRWRRRGGDRGQRGRSRREHVVAVEFRHALRWGGTGRERIMRLRHRCHRSCRGGRQHDSRGRRERWPRRLLPPGMELHTGRGSQRRSRGHHAKPEHQPQRAYDSVHGHLPRPCQGCHARAEAASQACHRFRQPGDPGSVSRLPASRPNRFSPCDLRGFTSGS